jgi:hypothetical protein
MNKLPHSCRLKLQRAQEHLHTLDTEIAKFKAGKPYRVTRKQDRARRKSVYSLWEKASPPSNWALLIGDCIHNFRCVLDHLAYDVVTRYSKPTPAEKDIGFPIMLNRSQFTRNRIQKYLGRRPRQGFKAAVERLQPYKRRQDINVYPLWILHRLDIIDKHRQLLATSMGNVQVTFDGSAGVPTFISGPFDDPTEKMRVEFPFGPQGPVQVNAQATYEILLNDIQMVDGGPRSSWLLPYTLDAIRRTLDDALSELARFCD